jgi:outer membrane protein assembly factor BamE (lipoprotein component of BamABCDE complex)
MKKIFKMGCLGIIGLVVLIVIIGVATNSGSKSSSQPVSTTISSTTTKTPAQTPKQDDTNKQASQSSTPAPTADNGVLTKAKFDQIQNGMTYDQVKGIVGSDGELISESGDKGSQFYTAMYQFKTDGFLSNASMTFQGGKLVNKAQIGLSGDSTVSINKSKFDQISNGMTYEQVQQIIGGPGDVISESGQKGTNFYTIMVQYKGDGDLGANANLMFQGDKLQNKAQFGLK